MPVRSRAPPPASRTATRWRLKHSSSSGPLPEMRGLSGSLARPARARAPWWMRWRSPCAAAARPSAIIAIDPTSRVSGGADSGRPHPHAAAPRRSGHFHPLHGHARIPRRAGARHRRPGPAHGCRRPRLRADRNRGRGAGRNRDRRPGAGHRGGAGARHGRRRADPEGGDHGDRRRVRGQQSRSSGRQCGGARYRPHAGFSGGTGQPASGDPRGGHRGYWYRGAVRGGERAGKPAPPISSLFRRAQVESGNRNHRRQRPVLHARIRGSRGSQYRDAVRPAFG